MVCAKCQKLSKGTTLATPEVKKKSEMYYGSSATSSSKASGTKSTTLGQNGIGKAGNNWPPPCCIDADRSAAEQASIQIGKEPLCTVLKVSSSHFSEPSYSVTDSHS